MQQSNVNNYGFSSDKILILLFFINLLMQPINSITCNAAHNRIDVGGVCVCAPGYYDGGPTNCMTCNALCMTCVTTATTCTGCNSALHLTISGTTCICMDGYVMVTGVCQPCHYSCRTCSGVLANNCITCNTAVRLFVSASTTCVCLNGTYDDTTAQSCQPCDAKCLWCSASTSNDCTNCDSMLLRAIGTSNPGPCICFNGYYDTTAALCAQCSYTCLTCIATATTCVTCDSTLFRTLSGTSCPCDAHYYDSGSATCTMCSPRCGNCITASTTCLTCNNTLRLLTGTTCPCISGYYQDTATITCLPCTNYCLTCENSSSTCLSCYSYGNRQLYNATCRCLTGFYDNGTIMCQTCPYQCVACVGPSPPVCTVCDASVYRSLVSGDCPCDSGYYDNGSILCQPCSYTCQTCSSSPLNCLSCLPTSHRTLTTSSCLCQLGYYQDNTSSICPQCHYSCLSCFDGTNTSCYTCQINRNYVNYSCPCFAGMYQLSQLCYNCDSQCATCVNLATECTSCPFSRMLNGSRCVCAVGFFVSGVLCLACDVSCYTCTGSSTYCTSCPAVHLTVLSSASCICPDTYYLPTLTQICQQCSPSCHTCTSSPTYCLSCPINSHRTLTSNSCPCNAGYYETSAYICANCHSACTLCIGSSNYNCTGCVSGFVLIGTYCKSLVVCLNYLYEGVCVDLCPDGTYGVLGGIAGNTCQQCISPCRTCSSPTYCLTCLPPYTYHATTHTCLQQCPSQMYSSASGCQSCPSTCTSCILNTNMNPNSVVCISCVAGHVRLDGGSCGGTCGVGWILVGGLCHRCGAYCESCIGLGYNACVRCKSGYYMLLGSCYQICPLGYTPNSTICSPCPTPCQSCLQNKCLSCSQGYFLSILTNQCIPQLYYKNSYGQLMPCHPNCRSCTDGSFSSCVVCSSMRGDDGEMAISGYCQCRQGTVDTGDGKCDSVVYQDVVAAAQVLVGATQAIFFMAVIIGVTSTNFIPLVFFTNYLQTYSSFYYLNSSSVLQTDTILQNYLNINPITYYNSLSHTENTTLKQSQWNNRLLLTTQTDQSLYLRGHYFQYLSQWGFTALVANVGVWAVAAVLWAVKGCCRGRNRVGNVREGEAEGEIGENQEKQLQNGINEQDAKQEQANKQKKCSWKSFKSKIGQYSAHFWKLYHQSVAIIFFFATSSEIVIYAVFSYKTLISFKLSQPNFTLSIPQLTLSSIICAYYLIYLLRLILGTYCTTLPLHRKHPLRILLYFKLTKSRLSKCFLPLLILRTCMVSTLMAILAYNPSYQAFSSLSVIGFFFLVNLCICPFQGATRFYFHSMQLTLVAQTIVLTYITALPQNSRITPSKVLITLNFIQIFLCFLLMCWVITRMIFEKVCAKTRAKKKNNGKDKIIFEQSMSNLNEGHIEEKQNKLTEIQQNEINEIKKFQNVTPYNSSKTQKIGPAQIKKKSSRTEHKISKKYRVKRHT